MSLLSDVGEADSSVSRSVVDWAYLTDRLPSIEEPSHSCDSAHTKTARTVPNPIDLFTKEHTSHLVKSQKLHHPLGSHDNSLLHIIPA